MYVPTTPPPTARRATIFGLTSREYLLPWVQVSLVDNEQVEALVRAMVEHFAAWGGLPVLAVFDRPKTIAIKCNHPVGAVW